MFILNVQTYILPLYNTNKQIRVFPEQLGYYPWAIMGVLPVVYP
jgi:hypothetical protein